MEGEFTVKIGKKLFEYTNANDIPEKFDHLIKFVPNLAGYKEYGMKLKKYKKLI